MYISGQVFQILGEPPPPILFKIPILNYLQTECFVSPESDLEQSCPPECPSGRGKVRNRFMVYQSFMTFGYRNVDKFVRFVNLMINDLTYLLDELLSDLARIH